VGNDEKVTFAVFEFGEDPNVVSDLLGIPPTKAWRKDDALPAGGRQTHSRWTLAARPSACSSVEAQLDDILTQLEACAPEVRKLASLYQAKLAIRGDYREEFNPEIELAPRTIQRLANLGLGLWFDLYFLGPDSK
jgi:hypothetical protein